MSIKYRPEIDGLRTIAVISVIIYHAELVLNSGHVLRGGFLGVDVFFVISGFLITSLILREREAKGQFSIGKFYERRARRLLPALLTVMLFSLPVAWRYLLPEQLVDFSWSLIASLLFASNFYWDASLQVYGAESGLVKPFLHTWSLAVEEQFYILYPLILLLIYRFAKNWIVWILMAGLIASLVYAQLTVGKDPSFAFYMLPSRFWELLAGGVLAYIQFGSVRPQGGKWFERTLPSIGLLLIVYGIVFTGFDANHPGIATIPSVLGTVLIIGFAHPSEPATKILSSRLFVGIGLISYSLYLWHYPIFAFGRIIDPNPSLAFKLLWIALTFALSIGTYYLIEGPFRNRQRMSVGLLVASTLIFAGGIGAVSAYWIKNDGFKDRLGYLAEVLEPSKRVWVSLDGDKCHSGGAWKRQRETVADSCLFSHNPEGKSLVLIGDSHAGSLADQLRQLAEKNGLNYIQITRGGCPHIIGYGSDKCKNRGADVVERLKQYPNSTIVYNARIPLFMEQSRFDNQEGDQETNYKPADPDKVKAGYEGRTELLVNTFEIWRDAGHELAIIYPVPEQGYSVAKKLFAHRPIIDVESKLPDLTTSYEVFRRRVQSSHDALDRVTGPGVFRIYPEAVFCDENTGRCFASKGKDVYFGTDHHVSPLGAKMIINEVGCTLDLQHQLK